MEEELNLSRIAQQSWLSENDREDLPQATELSADDAFMGFTVVHDSDLLPFGFQVFLVLFFFIRVAVDDLLECPDLKAAFDLARIHLDDQSVVDVALDSQLTQLRECDVTANREIVQVLIIGQDTAKCS